MKTLQQLAACVALSCSALILSGCKLEAQEEKQKEEVVIPVEVAQVYTGDISSSYQNAAYIIAEKQTQVVSKASGVVEKLFVEEGDTVSTGQALAQLDTEQLELELKQAKANLDRLANELERNKKIFKQNLISSDVFERAKYDYQSQLASYELIKLRLEYATIRAPFDGVISQRLIKIGNMVTTNSPAFQLTDFNSLKGEIHVPELELARFAKGQQTLIQVDALKGSLFEGTIERISPIIDQSSGTFKVTIALDNSHGKLRPGMFARFEVISDTHTDVLLVDKNGILSQDSEQSVFVVRDGIAKKQAITTGYIAKDRIEITSGLKAGDQIVVTGLHTLKDDSKVKVLSL